MCEQYTVCMLYSNSFLRGISTIKKRQIEVDSINIKSRNVPHRMLAAYFTTAGALVAAEVIFCDAERARLTVINF